MSTDGEIEIIVSEEERREHQLLEWLGVVVRFRALGASWRSIAKAFGGSKSWWGRQAPAIDDLVSQHEFPRRPARCFH